MLISILGPSGSGKSQISFYLTAHHSFTPVHILTSPRSLHLSPSSPSFPSSPFSSPVDLGTPTSGPRLAFSSASALLEYATAHWLQDFVTLDLSPNCDEWEAFEKRPFFLTIKVDAPVLVRWRRFNEKYHHSSPPSPSQLAGTERRGQAGQDGRNQPLSLEEFVQRDDLALLPPASTRLGIEHHGIVCIFNSFPTLSLFFTHLASLHLTSPSRLRPDWDTYFLSLCSLASLRSNCMKRRVGAVLVGSRRVLSTGYNGTPTGLRNCNQGGCPRCNASAACGTKLDECLCLHAEENALLEAGRARGGAEGTVLYCNTCPCLRCAVKIVQAGVKEVVYQLEYSMDSRSSEIFKEAGVRFRRYVAPE